MALREAQDRRVAAPLEPPPPSSRPAWLERALSRLRGGLRPDRDDAVLLPRRLPARIWALGLASFVATYAFMWSFVHVIVDMRTPLLPLDDPLYRLIPFDHRWWLISIDLYVIVILATLALMLVTALAGDHRPMVRWGVALTIVAVFRMITLALVPLGRAGLPPGVPPLSDIPYAELGPVRFPWHPFAWNDLLFSGHVSEALLALRATRAWPRSLRAGLWLFFGAQIVALLATRGHYTIDIAVAIPMAYLADRLALRLLVRAR